MDTARYIELVAKGTAAVLLVPASIHVLGYVFQRIDPIVGAGTSAVIGVGLLVAKLPNVAPMTNAEFFSFHPW